MKANTFRWASLTLAALAAFFAWDSWRRRAAAETPARDGAEPEYRLQIPDFAFGGGSATGDLGADIPYGGLDLPDVQTWELVFPDLSGPGTVSPPDLTLGTREPWQVGGWI